MPSISSSPIATGTASIVPPDTSPRTAMANGLRSVCNSCSSSFPASAPAERAGWRSALTSSRPLKTSGSLMAELHNKAMASLPEAMQNKVATASGDGVKENVKGFMLLLQQTTDGLPGKKPTPELERVKSQFLKLLSSSKMNDKSPFGQDASVTGADEFKKLKEALLKQLPQDPLALGNRLIEEHIKPLIADYTQRNPRLEVFLRESIDINHTQRETNAHQIEDSSDRLFNAWSDLNQTSKILDLVREKIGDKQPPVPEGEGAHPDEPPARVHAQVKPEGVQLPPELKMRSDEDRYNFPGGNPLVINNNVNPHIIVDDRQLKDGMAMGGAGEVGVTDMTALLATAVTKLIDLLSAVHNPNNSTVATNEQKHDRKEITPEGLVHVSDGLMAESVADTVDNARNMSKVQAEISMQGKEESQDRGAMETENVLRQPNRPTVGLSADENKTRRHTWPIVKPALQYSGSLGSAQSRDSFNRVLSGVGDKRGPASLPQPPRQVAKAAIERGEPSLFVNTQAPITNKNNDTIPSSFDSAAILQRHKPRVGEPRLSADNPPSSKHQVADIAKNKHNEQETDSPELRPFADRKAFFQRQDSSGVDVEKQLRPRSMKRPASTPPGDVTLSRGSFSAIPDVNTPRSHN